VVDSPAKDGLRRTTGISFLIIFFKKKKNKSLLRRRACGVRPGLPNFLKKFYQNFCGGQRVPCQTVTKISSSFLFKEPREPQSTDDQA
jgi:hypothetical protein